MKPEFARVCALLTDTVTLLCKNGVSFSTELKIQGVIGITVDKEVFVVHINELYGEGTELYNAADLQLKADVAKISSHALVPSSYSSRARQKSKHPIKFSSMKNIVKTEPNAKGSSEGQSEYPIDAKYEGEDDGTSNQYGDDSKDKSPHMTKDAVFDVDGNDDVRQFGSTSLSDVDGMKQGFDESWARNVSDEQGSVHDSWDRNIEGSNWQSYSVSAGASGSASSMLHPRANTSASSMLSPPHRVKQRNMNNSGRSGVGSAFLAQQGFRRQRVNASPGGNPIASLGVGAVHVDGRRRGGGVRTGSVSRSWKSLARVVCDLCCRSFTRRSSLIRHQTHMHAWHDMGNVNVVQQASADLIGLQAGESLNGNQQARIDLNDSQEVSLILNGSQQMESKEGTTGADTN